jgi:GT2 family glycosyltransferase
LKVKLLKDKNYHPQKFKKGDIVEIPYNVANRWMNRYIAVPISNVLDAVYYETDDNYIQHKRVSIVIPVYNALQYLTKCIESLVRYTKNYELILIDNGSDKATKSYLTELEYKISATVQANDKNMGFSYACNQGIELSSCDYICFLNSDTVVTPNWLGKLMKGFKMPQAGIVGPSTCFSGGKQMIKHLQNIRMHMSQQEINSVKTGSGIIETEIYGCCYCVARKVIKDIGVFDVDRYPIGGAEEKDFSWRAGKAGYKSYWVQDSYVHHYGNKTFIDMGIKPIEPRRKNDVAFKERLSDPNIFIENKVKVVKPAIPILTIVLDRLEYTKKSITALLENTDYPFKLFIFNNGSNAETTKYLEGLKDSRIELYHSRENLGLIPPMNMFFDKFKDSRYVAKVDNDTVVTKGWLGKLKEVMDTFPLFTLQADHYLAMPFKIEENIEFYKHCLGVEFKDGMVYFFKNSGGTGQLIRRSVIDKPIPKPRRSVSKGGLGGWCNMQVAKYKKYPSAFYTGVWIDRLDQVDTNKYKPVSDYPEYDQMIKKMRPWGLGYARMNIDELDRVKDEIREWYIKNVSSSLH